MELITFGIPSGIMGAVLGQGGERVTALRQQHEVQVHIENGDGSAAVRRVEIRGAASLVASQQMLGDISEAHSNSEITIHLLVSADHAGGIIGKAGANITQMRADNPNVKMNMEKAPQGLERPMSFTGTATDVCNAVYSTISLVFNGVANGTFRRENASAEKRRRIQTFGGGYGDQMVRAVDPGMGGLGGIIFPSGEPALSLMVANEHVGKIIGKQGNTISQLRSQSGCHIDIAKSEGPGPRTVTITGPLMAIENACRMLRQCLETA